MMNLHNRINKDELKSKIINSSRNRTTISFYKYFNLGNPHLFRDHLYQFLDSLEVLGRIYVAREGINAQISVPDDRMEEFQSTIGKEILFFDGMRLNIAVDDDGKSFYKLVVKVRNKILADGLDDATFDPSDRGNHLSAAEVNALAEKDETLFVDMRNHYEWEVGHFKDAILPEVETFRESLPIIEDMLEGDKEKDIVMYCTGGIRCEKASAYYKHKGFTNVHMIDGGIIKYARDCQKEGLDNLFVGKNFVFDERLGERISDEIIAHCHQCNDSCDNHKNCANDACHLLFIQCTSCADKYNGCCSQKCADFIKLPIEEQREKRKSEVFNGTRFGKGRYKAFQKSMGDLSSSNLTLD